MRVAIIIGMILLAGCDAPCFEVKGPNRYQIINADGMNLLLDTHEGRVWKQVEVAGRYVWQQQTILSYPHSGSGNAPINANDWVKDLEGKIKNDRQAED